MSRQQPLESGGVDSLPQNEPSGVQISATKARRSRKLSTADEIVNHGLLFEDSDCEKEAAGASNKEQQLSRSRIHKTTGSPKVYLKASKAGDQIPAYTSAFSNIDPALWDLGRKRLKTTHSGGDSSQLKAEAGPISSNTAAEILCNLQHTSGHEVNTKGEGTAHSARALRAEQRAQLVQKSLEALEVHRGRRRRQSPEASGNDARADVPGVGETAVETIDSNIGGIASRKEDEGLADKRAATQNSENSNEKDCATQQRVFPRHVDKQTARFPGFYQRYTVVCCRVVLILEGLSGQSRSCRRYGLRSIPLLHSQANCLKRSSRRSFHEEPKTQGEPPLVVS